jgi:hypothetical protein
MSVALSCALELDLLLAIRRSVGSGMKSGPRTGTAPSAKLNVSTVRAPAPEGLSPAERALNHSEH